jgi:hypothetical protein
LIISQTKQSNSLIRERKTGTSISSSAKTIHKSSAKLPADAPPPEALQINNFYQTTARSIRVEMNKFPPKDV